MTYWAIYTGPDILCHWSLARTRRESFAKFYAGLPTGYTKWRELYRRGDRCRKVNVEIVK